MGGYFKLLPTLSFRSAPVRFPAQRTNEVAMFLRSTPTFSLALTMRLWLSSSNQMILQLNS